MTLNTNQFSNPLPIFTDATPKEGTRAIPVTFDWSVQSSYAIDLSNAQNQARFSGIRCVYIDNGNNNGAVTIQTSALNQSMSLAAGYQGFFPLLVTNQVKVTVSSVGSVSTQVVFLNFLLPYGTWAANAAPAAIANPLPVSDAALEALISGGRLAVQQIEAACTEIDHSGTIAVGGTAQILMNANANRRGWRLQNIDSTLPSEEIWVRTTGTAVIGGAGSFAISAYSTAGFPGGYIEGKSTQAISIIAATTGHKFTAVEW
jgi:hypothetical protein